MIYLQQKDYQYKELPAIKLERDPIAGFGIVFSSDSSKKDVISQVLDGGPAKGQIK